MKIKITQPRTYAQSVTRYLTPFALLLVLMGAVAVGFNRATIVAIALIGMTSVTNYAMIRLMARPGVNFTTLRNFRIAFNYLFNIPLVYLLWPFWKPVWMLLLLSISSVATFEDRKTTTGTAALFTVVLFCIQFLRGSHAWATYCETFTYAASIWTVGLLINQLAKAEPEA